MRRNIKKGKVNKHICSKVKAALIEDKINKTIRWLDHIQHKDANYQHKGAILFTHKNQIRIEETKNQMARN